ncbi:hypothetical protein J5I95_15495 [Candidatus Poribacteria bacterium]|nr:hypothetical protein [Candidatus Poribacteria bacterium]
MDNSQQSPVPAHPNLTAEQDAESDAKKVTWFFIGFLGNILGVLIASIYEPAPPASRLLGKSPEDAAFYTDSYKAKSRSIQLRQSVIGLIIPFVFMFLWMIFIVAIL